MNKDNTYNEIRLEINKLEQEILQLRDISEHIVGGNVDNILKFNNSYTQIIKKHADIVNKIYQFDKSGESELWEKSDSLLNDLNYIYDESSIPINNVFATKTQELEEETRRNQGVQLAVFSIVLSILAFVLTNAKILAASQINFKNVLLVNLSFILCTNVLFSLIYLFMGSMFHNRKTWLSISVFIVLPILLITAIVFISIYMPE